MRLRPFLSLQVAGLLDALQQNLHRASEEPTEEAVHKLRVSIRRFTQTLKTFALFFPRDRARKVRRRLRPLMRLAAEVRNRDIALELLVEAKLPLESPVGESLRREREEAQRALVDVLCEHRHRDVTAKWRRHLGLEVA